MQALILFSAICGLAVSAPGYQFATWLPDVYGGTLWTSGVIQKDTPQLPIQANKIEGNTHVYLPTLLPFYAPDIINTLPTGTNGNVVDTPEVAQAKLAHFYAHTLETAKQLGLEPYGALSHLSAAYIYGFGYSSQVGPDGRVVDTPEVAKAKAAHLAIHAEVVNAVEKA